MTPQMNLDANRILANILILLKSGLFRGQHCVAVPEAIQLVEAMVGDTTPKAEDKKPEAEASDVAG